MEVTMLRRIKINTALRILAVIACTSAACAQTSSSEGVLATGDVWISPGDYLLVPQEPPGMVDKTSPVNAPLFADTPTPDTKNASPFAIKLNIAVTIRRAGISSAKNRAMRHRRAAVAAGHPNYPPHKARRALRLTSLFQEEKHSLP
jgi:hypothetical protein